MNDFLKGLEDQPIVNPDRCARCDRRIVTDNDSGWQVFVEGGSQPICVDCKEKEDADGEMRKAIEELISG